MDKHFIRLVTTYSIIQIEKHEVSKNRSRKHTEKDGGKDSETLS